jgi:D-lactate dehydrogenase
MKVAVFSTKPYDRLFLDEINRDFKHELHFLEPRLTEDTVSLAENFPAVCVFVNDQVDREVIERLAHGGTRLVATRSAG